jgi:hypothetical protein
MATTIASILNGNSLNTNASVISISAQKTAAGLLAPAANEDSNTASSSVTFISPSAHAMFSLESFQALATGILNQSTPPTVNDFKTVVRGVVTGLNGLRQTLANAAAANANYRESQRSVNTLNSINHTLANSPKAFVESLKSVGIAQQNDGSYSLNQNQLTKAFATNSNAAYSTVSNFASQVSDAADAAAKAASEKKAEDAAAQRAQDAKRQAAQSATQAAVPQPVVTQAPQAGVTQLSAPAPIPQASVQTPAPQPSDVQSTGASGFTAQTAVTTYLAVSSL